MYKPITQNSTRYVGPGGIHTIGMTGTPNRAGWNVKVAVTHKNKISEVYIGCVHFPATQWAKFVAVCNAVMSSETPQRVFTKTEWSYVDGKKRYRERQHLVVTNKGVARVESDDLVWAKKWTPDGAKDYWSIPELSFTDVTQINKFVEEYNARTVTVPDKPRSNVAVGPA
jgi:hypothetical protein